MKTTLSAAPHDWEIICVDMIECFISYRMTQITPSWLIPVASYDRLKMPLIPAVHCTYCQFYYEPYRVYMIIELHAHAVECDTRTPINLGLWTADIQTGLQYIIL